MCLHTYSVIPLLCAYKIFTKLPQHPGNSTSHHHKLTNQAKQAKAENSAQNTNQKSQLFHIQILQ